jgi:hypothetical protein
MFLHYRNKGRAIEPTLPEQKRPHEHTAQSTFRSASLEVGNTQDAPHITTHLRQYSDTPPTYGYRSRDRLAFIAYEGNDKLLVLDMHTMRLAFDPVLSTLYGAGELI